MSDTFNSVIVGNKVFRYRKEQILATDPPLDRHELSVKELSRQLEEARELLVKSNSQLDLTWYAIGCTVDDHAIKRLKSIYHRELDKLKEKGDEN